MTQPYGRPVLTSTTTFVTAEQDSQGSLELIDGRSLLPGLKCRPGLYDWLVVDTNRSAMTHTSTQVAVIMPPPCTVSEGP